VATLVVSVGILAFSGFRGAYSYRDLARSVTVRAKELPLAADLTQRVGDLRVALSQLRDSRSASHPGMPAVDTQLLREDFRMSLLEVEEALIKYRDQLNAGIASDPLISENTHELYAVATIDDSLRRIQTIESDVDWMLDPVAGEALDDEIENMQNLSKELPTFLEQRMDAFAGDVRGRYRTWIVLTWVTSVAAVLMLFSLGLFFYTSVFRPLGLLVVGSRRVADGEYDHRINIDHNDEVSELAGAMNDMTNKFQLAQQELQETIKGLDEEVKIRTREVVRSERLASVGFLAAGVAHEINNPLASIAWCAESLESRLQDIIAEDDELPDEEHNEEISVLKKYLRRIQDEAFRCKGITGSLLDYSRMSDVEKHETDLCELVEGVIEMVRHLGKYREKDIVFNRGARIMAPVNPQEIKQVMLNLITNGLDSLDPGGQVAISIVTENNEAVVRVEDNGCGMCEDTMEHLFEPFFTRRRDGQGTGLGLSITYRIVSDHGGDIQAFSTGTGQGSQFRVTLPLVKNETKENRQAA